MKRLIAWWMAACAAGCIYAQAGADEVRAKVRDVKLSGEYLYSEASSMNSAAEAKEAALTGIETEANVLLAEQNKSREEKRAVWGAAAGKVVCLEYTNGPLFKAMAYVPKSAVTEVVVVSTAATPPAEPVEPAKPVEPATPAKPEQVATPEQPAEPAPVLEMPVKNETDNEAVKQAKLAELVALPQKPLEDEKKGIDSTMPSEEQFRSKLAENVLKKLTWTQSTPPAVPDLQKELKPLDTVNTSTYNILTSLLKMDTYESVMLYLDAMKDDGRLMYGRLESAKSLERAYLIIIQEGKLVTLLNKGGRERVNLKTNQPEDVTRYIGYGIIWLQIF